MITVTKVFLPPINEYLAQVQRAYNNQWLTNRGELVKELEQKIMSKYNTVPLIIMNNGTVPLQIALKVIGEKGEIITTPFSYVATTSAIVWESYTPIFVDIHPEYFTIDETKIEAAITPKTKAILATHVFGNPCNVDAIESIAKKHQLKVIYDAAHCFGVSYKGNSVFNYGDVSTCSFHATKIFHTGEGGAAFVKESTLFEEMFYGHNFGHNGPLTFHGVGINGKISELQAAMGLAVFPYIDDIIAKRANAVNFYINELSGMPLQFINIRPGTEWNYSYFPVIFPSEAELLKVEKMLLAKQIVARRYFCPSLHMLPYVSQTSMPVSDRISSSVLCLPLYHNLSEEEQMLVINTIKDNF